MNLLLRIIEVIVPVFFTVAAGLSVCPPPQAGHEDLQPDCA